MQFLIAETTGRDFKYYPRHFRVLADEFAQVDWIQSVDQAGSQGCTIVVRSPGYHGLGRATSAQLGIRCSFDLMTPAELEHVRSGGGRVLLDLGWEMLNPAEEVVLSHAETLRDLRLDPTRVFICHSNQNARSQFNRHWLRNVGTQPPYNLEYPLAMALCVIHQQRNRDELQIAERAERARQRTAEGSRSRLFVSFNGEVRPHRFYVAAALESLGLLDRSHFSLVYPKKIVRETQEQFCARILGLLSKMPRGAEFAAAGAKILDRLPMELDIAAIPPGGIEDLAWLSQDPSFYDDSRFTVVIDTVVSSSACLFVTEKVLKPIMNHSPFMLIGSPGGADLLRSYGFKTFEPFIRQCESGGYTDILNHGVDEIERLARLGPDELDELSRTLAPICDYNARHFWDVFPGILRHKFNELLLALGPPSAD